MNTDIEKTIIAILADIRPEIDPEKETALIADGILDSFDIVTLIAEISDRLEVKVTADKILPEHFDSVLAICALVASLQQEDGACC